MSAAAHPVSDGTASGSARLDHLVVVAPTLSSGVAWCENTLGVTPGQGGAHPLMGTHNRLLRISGPDFPRAYLEIVAIEPAVTPTRAPPLRRWFDMDNEPLRARIAAQGPQLAHFVASVPDLAAALAALASQGIDCGRIIEASRLTPHGLLQWRITVRDDGRRLFGGALPTLIEWGADGGAAHPAQTLPDCGVRLTGVRLSHPDSPQLQAACTAIGLTGVAIEAGTARLSATLLTPRGGVTLTSD